MHVSSSSDSTRIAVPVRGALPMSGRVVGAMQTGIILGMLLSRTVSGAVGEFSGSWRASYFLAAVLTGLLFFVLPRFIPDRPRSANTSPQLSYGALLASLPRLLLKWRGLRLSSALGASMFGAFSALWATLAFHLAEAPFGYGSAQAGMFGLFGAAGALAAPFCGRLSDRFGATTVNLIALGAASIAFAAFFAGGGAIGSALGVWAWSVAGWQGVCAAGAGLLAIVGCLLLASVLFRQPTTAPAA